MGENRNMMWKLTLVLNALLMGVFAFSSAASQIMLRNNYIRYSDESGSMPLPAISDLALKIQWALLAVPVIWAMLTFVLIILNWRKAESPRDVVQLHTSATVLFGLFMLGFFIIAGILPFLSMTVKLR